MNTVASRIPDWNTVETTTLVRYVNVESVRDGRLEVAQNVISEHSPSLHELVETDLHLKAAEVVYNALAAEGVDYTGPGYASAAGTQRVFMPHALVKRGRGTCVDFAVAYCTLALDVTLRPYLVGTPGHVFAMVANSAFAPILPDDIERADLAPLIENAQLIPVETTGAADGDTRTFKDAVETARERLRGEEIEFVLDVQQLQQGNNLAPYDATARHRRLPRAAIAIAAALTLCAIAGMAYWLTRPDPMPGNVATNIAVFEFIGDESGAAEELTARLSERLNAAGLAAEGWKVAGPFSGPFPTESDEADATRLKRLNAGAGIYATVDGDTLDSLGIWVTPEMAGASFHGALGPSTWIERFPNVNASGRFTVAQEQIESFVELSQSLSEVHNAFGQCDNEGSNCDSTDDAALDSASRSLLQLTESAGASRTAAYQTQQLARLSLSSVSLSRLIYPSADGELRVELVEISRRMLTDAFQQARVNSDALMELRASIGTSNLLIAVEQCSGRDDGLETASRVLEQASNLLGQMSGSTRTQAEIRLAQGNAELDWCRWKAGGLDRHAAINTHDQAISVIGAPSSALFEELQQHLLADARFQRAELRAGFDAAGCAEDLEAAFRIAPVFARPVYEAQAQEWSCAS